MNSISTFRDEAIGTHFLDLKEISDMQGGTQRDGMCSILHYFSSVSLRHFIILFTYSFNERGSIVIRAHASHAEGLRFKPDSMP